MDDGTGRKIIGHIEAIAQVVVPAIMNIDRSEEGDDGSGLTGPEATYVGHLCSFSE